MTSIKKTKIKIIKHIIAVKPIRTFIVKVIYLLFIYYINYNRYHISISV